MLVEMGNKLRKICYIPVKNITLYIVKQCCSTENVVQTSLRLVGLIDSDVDGLVAGVPAKPATLLHSLPSSAGNTCITQITRQSYGVLMGFFTINKEIKHRQFNFSFV